jgi:hypothetical protein
MTGPTGPNDSTTICLNHPHLPTPVGGVGLNHSFAPKLAVTAASPAHARENVRPDSVACGSDSSVLLEELMMRFLSQRTNMSIATSARSIAMTGMVKDRDYKVGDRCILKKPNAQVNRRRSAKRVGHQHWP